MTEQDGRQGRTLLESLAEADAKLVALEKPKPAARPRRPKTVDPHGEHYHAWLVSGSGKMAYMSRPFGTKQAAHAWARRRQPQAAFRMVHKCGMAFACPRPPKPQGGDDDE